MILGICKHVLARGRRSAERRARECSIRPSSSSIRTVFDAFEAEVRATSGRRSRSARALPRRAIEGAAQVYVEAERVIGILRHGSDPARSRLRERGDACQYAAAERATSAATARESRRCAAIPTCRASAPSASPRSPKLVPLDKLAAQFGFEPPREKGMNTVEACEGILSGKVKAFFGLGGNFVRAIPGARDHGEGLDADATDRSDRHQAQSQPSGQRQGRPICCPVSAAPKRISRRAVHRRSRMEDTFSCIHGSHRPSQAGQRTSADRELAIVAGLAKATLPPNPKVHMGRLGRRLRPGSRPHRGNLSGASSTTSTSEC